MELRVDLRARLLIFVSILSLYIRFTHGGRPVALKVVRKEFADDPEFRRRFLMEVAAAQRVQGLYNAPVVDADLDAPVRQRAASTGGLRSRS